MIFTGGICLLVDFSLHCSAFVLLLLSPGVWLSDGMVRYVPFIRLLAHGIVVFLLLLLVSAGVWLIEGVARCWPGTWCFVLVGFLWHFSVFVFLVALPGV